MVRGTAGGVVLIFGVVAHALDLMVPEVIRKKLEPMQNTSHDATRIDFAYKILQH